MTTIFENFKILLIDDEEDIVDILATVLKREGFSKIYTATTAQDGLNLFAQIKPDIVLLDIMLPDINGYDVFKQIRLTSDIPVLFISAKSDEVDRLLGFALGADDYITKPFSAKEVVFRVKARLKHLENFSNPMTEEEKVIKFGDIEIHPSTKNVFKNGKHLELTAKELKLLLYLVSNPNRIISKEMICEHVWGENFFGYDNTITVHIRKIRKKIEINPSKPTYITTVIGLGYRFIKKEASDEN